MDAGRVIVTYKADTSDLERGTAAARSALQSVGQAAQSTGALVQSAFAGGLAALGLQSVLGLVGSALGSVQQLAIGMNADLEKVTQQFKVFTGSAAEAEAHVRSLYDFAKTTPFETRPVIEASRYLRLFGGAALDTSATLTLVGNAAAATSAPIQEVAFWFGRAYAAIQGGRPFGEARQRLQELGVITPQAAAALEELERRGGRAGDKLKVLTDDVGRFEGAMREMADLWEGLTSTIRDAVTLAGKDIFAPWFDLLKDGLKSVRALLESDAFGDFVASATAASQLAADGFRAGLSELDRLAGEVGAALAPIGETLAAVAQQALEWGAAIVLALADGMAGALDVLTTVMSAITDLLAFWLAPGSPPRVAPDLDRWGASAMQQFLDGFLAADFRVFDQLAGTIETAIRTIAAGAAPTDLLGWMLETRTAIAQAIGAWREYGAVGADALDRIEAAAGPAGSAVRDLAAAYFELADAQREVEQWTRELERLNREQEAALRPILAAQQQLADQERQRADEERLAAAADKVARGKMSLEEFALLQQRIALAQREREIRASFRAPIDEAKAELALAKEREAAAQAEWDRRKGIVEIHAETRRLVEELTKAAGGAGRAMGQLATETGRVATALAGAATAQQKLAAAQAALGGLVTLLTQADPEQRIAGFTALATAIGETPAERIALLTSGLHGLLQALSGDLEGGLRRVGDAMNGLAGREDADDRLATLGRSLEEVGAAAARVGALVLEWGRTVFGAIRAAAAAVQQAHAVWTQFTSGVGAGASAAATALLPPFHAIAEWLGSVLPPVVAAFQALWHGVMAAAGAAVELFWAVARPVLTGAAEAFAILSPLAEQFGALGGAVFRLVGEAIGLFWSVAELVVRSFDLFLRASLLPTLQLFGAVTELVLTAARRHFELLWAVVSPILAEVQHWFAEKGKLVLEAFTTDLKRRVTEWTEFFDQARQAVGWLEDRIREFIAWLANLAVPNPFAGIIGAIGGLTASVAAQPSGGGREVEGRATGGPVERGRLYLVGERGPEWFVPAASGSIVPPAAPSRSVTVGSVTVHPTLSVTDGRLDALDLDRMGEQIAARVLDAIVLAGAGLSAEGI